MVRFPNLEDLWFGSGKVHVLQAQGPEVDSQHLHNKLGMTAKVRERSYLKT